MFGRYIECKIFSGHIKFMLTEIVPSKPTNDFNEF